MTGSRPSVVYLGNLANMAAHLESAEDVRLAGWIVEEGDELWRGESAGPSLGPTFVKNLDDLARVLRGLSPFDLGILANFGLILSDEMLASASRGFVNVHFGFLPDRPGRHPIVAALRENDPLVGMTLHRATVRPDEGPILAQRSLSAGARRDPSEIFDRMAASAPAFVAERLPFLLQ